MPQQDSNGLTSRRALPGAAAALFRPAALRSATADLFAAIDSLGTALIVLDGLDRLVAANRAARRVLDAGDAVVVDDGALRFLRSADALAWRRLRAAHGAIPAMSLPRSTGKPSYVVLVSRLARSTADSQPSLLLRIVDPCATAPPEPAVLEAALGISRAEARVVTELARGASVREVAAKLGLSHYTVRDHLKRVFRACDVRTQAQLMLIVGRLGRVASETGFAGRDAPSSEGVARRYMLHHDRLAPEIETFGATRD
jgi:DNA-binding CsgD family transcriptional regulator